MIIGVDIDGTIKNTRDAAVTSFNEELGKCVNCKDVKDFYMDKAYGITRKEGRRLWRKLEAKIYALGIPLENAAKVLTDLKEKGHTIYFITARPNIEKVACVTREWLEKHGFPYDGENLYMNSQNKGKVARELGVELFFEDDPHHLDNLIQAKIPTVVMDAIYNMAYTTESKGVYRMTHWDQAYQWIEKEAGSRT
ncbi:Uncharacterized protein, HAD superfamily [Marininema mesophilum]|uniref:Nucleotidase n=1 Tax=Marininema mesophilum TaxID=1048340 RepID=A0A1H2VDA5_9BACL|nr:hypothetical protein [Marininema mesophilum]SDW66337.1 Uncharacterized protein, HAD superfamily [Marininema mesophilum]